MAGAIETKTGFKFQLRLIRQDGECRDVLSKASCELDDNGNVTAVIGVFQDITESVRAIKSAQRNEARFRDLTDTAPDIITETTLDGTMTFISPAALSITGYPVDELLGRTSFSMMHPDDAPRLFAMCNAVFLGKGAVDPWPVEYRMFHKDGHEIWLESKPTPVRNPENGRIIGFADVIRDISSHKALEADLRAARLEAEAAANVKSDFLANMSHELRTPLTAVLGFSQLVSEQPELKDQTRQFAARVLTAGQALRATVNDILDFSKLEAGQVEIALEPSAIMDLLNDSLSLFDQQADQKKLKLELHLASSLPSRLDLDTNRIRQILLNLIGNAVKFTDAGAVRVEASYDDGDSMMGIRVVDTGQGVPQDKADRLFQRFSQVDASSTRRHGGTGLGLAICKGLVEAMGGEIGVESQEGVGSNFYFRVPAVRSTEPEAAVGKTQDGPGHLLCGCRILVADDNPLNRKLVTACMYSHDVELVEAEDGQEAVNIAAKRPFDVILMDLRMPFLNGKEAAALIRSGSGPNSATSILAFSADVFPDLGSGLFNGVIAKPLVGSTLIDAILTGLKADIGFRDNVAA